jgi:hypothetical protein
MSCGCASRLRGVLRLGGYTLGDDGVWRKEGHNDIPDARVEEEHFRVLIESLSDRLFHARAANFLRKTRRST